MDVLRVYSRLLAAQVTERRERPRPHINWFGLIARQHPRDRLEQAIVVHMNPTLRESGKTYKALPSHPAILAPSLVHGHCTECT